MKLNKIKNKIFKKNQASNGAAKGAAGGPTEAKSRPASSAASNASSSPSARPPAHPGSPLPAGGDQGVGLGKLDTSSLIHAYNHGGGGSGQPSPSTPSSKGHPPAHPNHAQHAHPPPHPLAQHTPRPGYASGGSTPDTGSVDGNGGNGSRRGGSNFGPNGKGALAHSNSILGLDHMIEERKETGHLTNNVVHIEVPFGKPIEEVYDGVHDGHVLGSGISGMVRLITHRSTKVQYAVKCLDLSLVETEEGLQQLREEIYIMCQLDHPNIVRLEEVYESHSEIYLVQELCIGGELFDRLDEQPDYHYNEAQCARLVKQMLCSVRYIHSKGIIHRDLKLENFLFSSTEPDSELKMIDFGLSKHFKFGEVQHEAVGTPYTVAPEVIRGSYDERCDVWALGVITFLLLSGDPPFGGCGGPEPLLTVRENIINGRYAFEPEDVWEHVSSEARDFIKKLLVTDPNRRPTAREVQRSTWLGKWASREKALQDPMLNPSVVSSLVNFKEYSDMRKLLCEVLSFTLLPDQIADLRKEFEKMDTDGSGEISLGGLKHVLLENAVSGSLGGLTEEEVEDIFNAMRVRKTETRFHWHEFIAAGLSHCRVDERNIRLAFDRLDSDHKGYITFEDVMDLMGNDASQSEDAMRRMWGDSMKDCDNHGDSRIGYDDFILLMKGQTRNPGGRGGGGGVTFGLGLGSLDPVSESISEQHSVDHSEETPVGSSVSLQDDVIVLPSGDIVCVADGTVVEQKEEGNASMGSGEGGVGGGPVSSGAEEPGASAALSEDIGLSFDEDEAEAEDEAISGAADKRIAAISDDNPPQTPKRGASDFNSPNTYKEKLSPVKPISSAKEGPLDIDRPDLGRRRSRSVDDQDRDQPSEGERGALSKEDSKPKLALNRELYRHHRQMRLAVLEASKRFEDQYLYHEMERLKAENAAGKKAPAAGLTMRHGLRELSTEAIQLVMLQQQKKQQQQVETATRRGGRGRRSRKKTVSDMSAMLASVPPVEMVMDPAPPFATANSESDKVSGGLSQSGIQSDSKQLYHLKPTTPGVFRKTIDPFSEMTGRIAGLKSQGQERRSNSMELASSAAIMNPSSGISTKIGKSPLAAANDKPTILASSSDGDLQKLEREGSDDRKQWPPPPPLS